MVATLPAADHPDESIVSGDRLIGDTAELACRLRHIPPAHPAPFAQRPTMDPGQGTYLRVAWRVRSTPRVTEDSFVLPVVTIARQLATGELDPPRWCEIARRRPP